MGTHRAPPPALAPDPRVWSAARSGSRGAARAVRGDVRDCDPFPHVRPQPLLLLSLLLLAPWERAARWPPCRRRPWAEASRATSQARPACPVPELSHSKGLYATRSRCCRIRTGTGGKSGHTLRCQPTSFCNLGQIISKSQDIKASKAVTHAISWVGTEARTWQ